MSHEYEEHDDDKPIGRILSRREMLAVVATRHNQSRTLWQLAPCRGRWMD